MVMKERTLSEFVEEHGQTATAEKLGVTQGAVWQMLKNKRAIYVVETSNGQLNAFEKKPVGRRAA